MDEDRRGYFEIQHTVTTPAQLRSVADIPALQHPRVPAIATRAATAARAWADRFPALLQNRIDGLARTCATLCLDFDEPTADAACAVAMKVAVSLFAIDDVVDGTVVEPRDDEADALLVLCRDLADSGGRSDVAAAETKLAAPLSPALAPSWRDAARAFADYCQKLVAGPGADHHYPFFARMFSGAMEGMRDELAARREFIESGAVPAFADYLDAGQRSIASPAVYAAVLVALAPQLPEVRGELLAAQLDGFALAGGACLRLANDVRSYKRELEVEQRPNSVVVVMRETGSSEAEAQAAVIHRADEQLHRMHQIAATLPGRLRPWTKAVGRFTTVMRDWYMLRELHD